MNETSFASLSPSLLARKGSARPAMRPQHGGMLGSPDSAAQTSSSDRGLDDLGWNDMGDDAPQNDADIIQLTPAPANEQTAAEARDLDKQTDAKLAELAIPQSPARDQQEVLAKRLEKTAPPLLSDAVKDDDEPNDLMVPEQPILATKPIVAPAVSTPIIATKNPKSALAKPPQVRRVAATDQGKRAAFTLRLDPERHLKLRLASTIRGRSAQQIVTNALDAYLGEMPNLEALAAQVKRN